MISRKYILYYRFSGEKIKEKTSSSPRDTLHVPLFTLPKFSPANSPCHFFAASSYAFAASVSLSKYPKCLRFPLLLIHAAHRLSRFFQYTPLYFETDPRCPAWFRLFSLLVQFRRFCFLLSNPCRLIWSQTKCLGVLAISRCISTFLRSAPSPALRIA